MATVQELVEQYQKDEALQKEVADILADGKISINEFLSFAKKHNVNILILSILLDTFSSRKFPHVSCISG